MDSKDPLYKQSYLDGELDHDKVIELEKALSEEEKATLEKELHFHHDLNQHIQQEIKNCPENTWENLKKEISSSQGTSTQEPETQTISIQVILPTLIKFAAVLLVAILMYLGFGPQQGNIPSNVSDMALENSFRLVEKELLAKGYHINFSTPDTYHPIELVKLDWVSSESSESSSPRLLFMCCDYPVYIYVQKASKPDIRSNQHKELIHHLEKKLKGYKINAHSDHKPDEVLDIIF